jgi:hypothetical protein
MLTITGYFFIIMYSGPINGITNNTINQLIGSNFISYLNVQKIRLQESYPGIVYPTRGFVLYSGHES